MKDFQICTSNCLSMDFMWNQLIIWNVKNCHFVNIKGNQFVKRAILKTFNLISRKIWVEGRNFLNDLKKITFCLRFLSLGLYHLYLKAMPIEFQNTNDSSNYWSTNFWPNTNTFISYFCLWPYGLRPLTRPQQYFDRNLSNCCLLV